MELVQHLNVQLTNNKQAVEGMQETVDGTLYRLKNELQGEIDGNNDGLKKAVGLVETEIGHVRKG